MKTNNNQGFKSLKVYQLAYMLAMEIFEMTKTFPKEEKIAYYKLKLELFKQL